MCESICFDKSSHFDTLITLIVVIIERIIIKMIIIIIIIVKNIRKLNSS